MTIAREGLREIALATLLLGAAAGAAFWFFWPLAIPFVVAWIWAISFFRDPRRVRRFEPGDLCAPADGRVTEISDLADYPTIEGPVARIGIFLSLWNVHINRFPCAGKVRAISYRRGEYLDARRPDSGRRNESNTLLIDPDPPLPGPVEVRQIAGFAARRIICHAAANQHLPIGARFGLIKFGSRTELIIPRRPGTRIQVAIGDTVRGGLTILATQEVECSPANAREGIPGETAVKRRHESRRRNQPGGEPRGGPRGRTTAGNAPMPGGT